MASVLTPQLSVYIFAMSADNYELDQVKTLKFFRLNCPRDKVTITQLVGRAGWLTPDLANSRTNCKINPSRTRQ